jgi:hypothetical protein
MHSRFQNYAASPLRTALLATAFAFAWGTAAANSDRDGDIDLTGTVAPVPASVTLSTTGLPTYASYNVTLTHYPLRDEALKPVYFSATTTVLDVSNVAVPGQAAAFQSPLPTGCSVNALTPTVLDCTFADGLTLAGSTIAFTVTVKAPSAGHHVAFTPQASYVEPPRARRSKRC